MHDPRLVYNTQSVCKERGIKAVQSQTGHLFMKQAMRDNDAIYGGEISAHHYFRDFYYCDSGMIPWLIVCVLVGRENTPLGELVRARMELFPSSGEVNFKVHNPDQILAVMQKRYSSVCLGVDTTDGLSFSFDDWRFNLRASNTEPLMRLNIETKGDGRLLNTKLVEITKIISEFGGEL